MCFQEFQDDLMNITVITSPFSFIFFHQKRALKLQQQKQKEELTRAHNLEKELEKERMLTARVASTQD